MLASFTASITGFVVVPEQFVQVGSPPPVTVAVFTVGFAAFAATATGTVITTGPLVPEATVQPARLVAPLAGQPLKVPPVAVIAPLVLTPAGNTSLTLIAAVVGPLATLIVIVYTCPVPPTTSTAGVALLVTVNAGAAPAVTVNTAVSQIVVFGAGAHTLYVTVQLAPVVPG